MKLSGTGLRIAAATLAAGALVPLAAPAQAQTAPNQRFAVGFQVVDGEPARLSLVASGTASGRGSVEQDYVATPTGFDVIVTFVLAEGTVSIRAEGGQLERVMRFQACQATGALDIPYAVVDGSGAYAGATGAGRLTEHQTLVGRRDEGTCLGPDSGRDPHLVVGQIVAEGTLELP